MQNFEEIGYKVKYDLYPKFVVKSVGSGSFSGITYDSSIKIFSRNIFERLNSKTQAFDEIIEEIIFKIPCKSDEEAKQLSNIFRNIRNNGEVVVIEGNLPNQNNEVLVLNDVNYFVNLSQKKSK